MIEKRGDENLLKRKVDDGETVKEKKKKKKIAKSYLDDLWIKLRENKCDNFVPNIVIWVFNWRDFVLMKFEKNCC